jgi:hypothetical protein
VPHLRGQDHEGPRHPQQPQREGRHDRAPRHQDRRLGRNLRQRGDLRRSWTGSTAR